MWLAREYADSDSRLDRGIFPLPLTTTVSLNLKEADELLAVAEYPIYTASVAAAFAPAPIAIAASAVAAALDVKLFHLTPPMTTVASLVDCAAFPMTT